MSQIKKLFPVLFVILGFSGFLIGQLVFDVIDSQAQKSTIEDSLKLKLEDLYYTHVFETTESEKFKLADKKASIVIVNFWASWCAPCLEEMPALNQLFEKFDKNEIYILGINTDEEEQLKNIKKTVKDFKIIFPTVADKDGKYIEKFNVENIPSTVIYVKGKVVDIIKGKKNFLEESFISELKKLISSSK